MIFRVNNKFEHEDKIFVLKHFFKQLINAAFLGKIFSGKVEFYEYIDRY